MKLMVNPDAKPVARHSLVPVPLHWRDAGKKGSIVMLGLDSVPVGESVTWCQMMVVCV